MGAVFLKCLFCKKYHVPCIYTARTYKNALTAKHALFNFIPDLFILSPLQENIHFPQAEMSEHACGTCSRTASAFDAKLQAWFPPDDIINN